MNREKLLVRREQRTETGFRVIGSVLVRFHPVRCGLVVGSVLLTGSGQTTEQGRIDTSYNKKLTYLLSDLKKSK